MRRNPCPIDRIHRRKPHFLAEGRVIEHGLDQILAGIEIALDRDIADIGRQHAGHLPALHFAGAAFGVQDDDINRRAIPAGFNGGGARIARGRANNRDTLPTLGQHVIEKRPEQLQRHILEGERRAMEQLQRKTPLIKLDQRHNGRMAKPRIGFLAQLFERQTRPRE